MDAGGSPGRRLPRGTPSTGASSGSELIHAVAADAVINTTLTIKQIAARAPGRVLF
jgi:hypothetical protein